MKKLAVFLTASALAAPAFAGSLATPIVEPVVTPVAAPIYAPSADWSGFYAGGQLGYADIDSNGAGIDGNGMLGGVHAGYRWDMGNTVLGLGADYDSADIDLGGTVGTLDSVARLKAQVGVDLGKTLVYATTGVAWADATVGGASLSDNGYFLGAGLDYALSDQWTVGGEVLAHKFDNFDNSGVDLDATTVAAKVSFRF